jgi:hypothetical protein
VTSSVLLRPTNPGGIHLWKPQDTDEVAQARCERTLFIAQIRRMRNRMFALVVITTALHCGSWNSAILVIWTAILGICWPFCPGRATVWCAAGE